MKRSWLPFRQFFSMDTDIVPIIQIVSTIISLVIVSGVYCIFSGRIMCGNEYESDKTTRSKTNTNQKKNQK